MSAYDLLMVHADDHEPVIEPLQAESTAEVDELTLPSHLWDEGGDPNDLPAQRWGVIAPAGDRGDRLLELVAPLIAHRREQQGGHPVKVYRVPAAMSAREAASWKKNTFRDGADLDIELPRYQLILGDLHEVPLAVQQGQATDGFVGRLAFDLDEHYEAYVDKVLRWERTPHAAREGRALFHTVHDGTSATRVGHSALMEPSVEVLRKRLEQGQLNADRIDALGDDIPNPNELLDAAQLDRPGVLFSLSHGEGPPRAGWSSDQAQREGQGTMSFGREGRLSATDLATRPFMPGGTWFMLACFSAGSPDQSAFRHWLEDLRRGGQYRGDPRAVLAGIPKTRPFIAAIPKAVLANPNGPLGFYGHIDLAWTYSFQELDQGPIGRPAKYMGILRALLKRDRLGIGGRELLRFRDQAESELASIADEAKRTGRPLSTADRAAAHLWMLRQDLGAYVLLGDPAARLPLASPQAPEAARSTWSAPAPSPVAQTPRVDTERIEEAIGRVLVGDESIEIVAQAFGLSRDDLRRWTETYREAGRAALGWSER